MAIIEDRDGAPAEAPDRRVPRLAPRVRSSDPSGSPWPAGVELRHLRYFTVVAEELHFTRAANRLHMAQSPLSAQIRQLEQRLGVVLLDRSGGRVALTAAGTVLLGHARRILSDIDDVVTEVEATARGQAGVLRLGLARTVSLDHTIRLRQRLAAAAPDVLLSLVRLECTQMVDKLVGHEIDVLLAHGPVDVPQGAFLPFTAEGWVVAVPRRHRFAHNTTVAADELRYERLMVLGGCGVRPTGVDGGRSTVCDDLDGLLGGVATGDGVAVLPAGAVASELTTLVRVLPLDGVAPAPIGVAVLDASSILAERFCDVAAQPQHVWRQR